MVPFDCQTPERCTGQPTHVIVHWVPPTTAEWARDRLGFSADAVQTRVLNSSAKRGILNCTRQWGKSTVAAAKAVYQACVEPGSLTIVVSPTARQSGELVRKASVFAARLGVRPQGDGDNEISLQFPSGSRIVGLPGSEATVRGFSAVSLLIVDEASRVSDDLYLAVRPMLAVSEGTMWLMSTPYGRRGFFYEVWEHGGPEWERVRVTAAECPRIKPEFLAGERRAMGDRWFRQEFECEFSETAEGVFSKDVIDEAFSEDFAPLKI